MNIDPRLTKLFGAAARVCLLHDHELGEPGRADAIEILRETVNSMSPLTAETACSHEPFEGRCVHCGVPFVGGRPSPLTAERAGAEPVAWLQRWQYTDKTWRFGEIVETLFKKRLEEFGVYDYPPRPVLIESIPLYAAPPAGSDAIDAARYRWLRVQKHVDIAACWFLPAEAPFYAPSTPSEIDAAIDTARAVTPPSGDPS